MKTKQPKSERKRVNWAIDVDLHNDIEAIAREVFNVGGKVNLMAVQLLRDAVARYKAEQSVAAIVASLEANDNA